MEKLLNTVKDILAKSDISKGKSANIQKVLESLYFGYIKKWYKFLQFSEEYQIAKDLQNLQNKIKEKPINLIGYTPKSRLIKSEVLILSRSLSQKKLKKHEINLLKAEIIEKYDYYLKAVFIADIIYHDYKKERRKWVLGILLGFISSFLITNWDWVKDLIVKK